MVINSLNKLEILRGTPGGALLKYNIMEKRL